MGLPFTINQSCVRFPLSSSLAIFFSCGFVITFSFTSLFMGVKEGIDIIFAGELLIG